MSPKGKFITALASVLMLMGLLSTTSGAVVASITVEPTAGLDFGENELGFYSKPLRVAFRSIGDEDLIIESVEFTGPDAGDFEFAFPPPCPPFIRSTESCNFSVFFNPRALGERSAVMEVKTNANEGTIYRDMRGVGIPQIIMPPKTIFTKKPKARIVTRSRKLDRLEVAFRSSRAGSTFQCSLDRSSFAACRSPKVLRKLAPGRHLLKIRSVDSDGRVGAPSVSRFTIVRRK